MADEDTNAQVHGGTPDSNPALKELEHLLGRWDVELRFPVDPPGTIHAEALFEWLEGGAFLIEHFGGSRWIIGLDDTNETYYVLYHDDRGVSRMYQMSLDGDVWKLWRDSPGFSQRFEGRFSDDGKTIVAYWEKCMDNSSWERDFDLTYMKVG